MMDTDLAAMSRDQLIAEVRKLQAGIRKHLDSTGQQFLRGCIRYRQSLDTLAPRAPRSSQYDDEDA